MEIHVAEEDRVLEHGHGRRASQNYYTIYLLVWENPTRTQELYEKLPPSDGSDNCRVEETVQTVQLRIRPSERLVREQQNKAIYIAYCTTQLLAQCSWTNRCQKH